MIHYHIPVEGCTGTAPYKHVKPAYELLTLKTHIKLYVYMWYQPIVRSIRLGWVCCKEIQNKHLSYYGSFVHVLLGLLMSNMIFLTAQHVTVGVTSCLFHLINLYWPWPHFYCCCSYLCLTDGRTS